MTIKEDFATRLAEVKRLSPAGYVSDDDWRGLISRVANNHGVMFQAVEDAIGEAAVE